MRHVLQHIAAFSLAYVACGEPSLTPTDASLVVPFRGDNDFFIDDTENDASVAWFPRKTP